MKKILKFVLLPIVVLVVLAAIVVWFYLGSIVRRTVEVQATNSLNLQTTLDSAKVSVFGGELELVELQIASPAGFKAERMFTLEGIDIGVSYGQLRNQPIHINSIQIDKPMLVIEQSGGKFNFQVLMDQTSKDPAPSEGEPIRLIINDLEVNGATVVIKPGIPGLNTDITVPVPSLKLQNIGTGEGNQNGVAIKQVVGQVVTSLAGAASNSDLLPPEVRQLLQLNVAAVAQQLGEQFRTQLGAVSGDLNKALGEITKDPRKAGEALKGVTENLEGAGKNLEKGLGGLLKPKKDEPTTAK